MTASERATAGSVRSAHVAHFLPPDWGRIALIAAPALERSTRDASAPQLLILVPDAAAAVALARAVAQLPAAEDLRIVAATSASRTKRLLAAGPAQVVIGSSAILAPAVASTALKLDQVGTVIFAAADELDADDADLATILTEVPKTATRVLTALEANASVEALLERHLHKARRIVDDVTPVEPETPTDGVTNVRFLTVAGSTTDALPQVLDEVDAPSATIVVTDAATTAGVHAILRAIGCDNETLARVTSGDVASNTTLVITLGIPTGTVWAQIIAAKPAQVVAIIAPRQRAALQKLAGESPVTPFAARSAVLKARAADARARAELRDMLAAGVPNREVLALEPLLGEFDGLEIAAAALKLLERTRAQQDELVKNAEIRVRTIMKEAMAEKEASREQEERGDRGERTERPREFAPRSSGPRTSSGPRGGFGARGDRPSSDRGERPPRAGGEFPLREPGERPHSSAPRGDKPYAPRGDKPYAPRADKPYAPRGDKPYAPRGDKPYAPRGDKPYAPRGDKPYAPRGDKPYAARGDKPYAPRSDKPRGPRRDDEGGRGGPRGPRTPR